MAGGGDGDVPKFTGLAKYFNSYTVQGRANFVMATYAGIALIYLCYKLKPSKPAEPKK